MHITEIEVIYHKHNRSIDHARPCIFWSKTINPWLPYLYFHRICNARAIHLIKAGPNFRPASPCYHASIKCKMDDSNARSRTCFTAAGDSGCLEKAYQVLLHHVLVSKLIRQSTLVSTLRNLIKVCCGSYCTYLTSYFILVTKYVLWVSSAFSLFYRWIW